MKQPFRQFLLGLSLILAWALMGCAPPIGVKRVGEDRIYRQSAMNAISSGQPSIYAAQLIARLGLGERFESDPTKVLAELHEGLGKPDEQDRLFVLAELSYLYAKKTQDPSYFTAASLYAYLLLFPEEPESSLSPYDPRLYLTMELYNSAIANGLRESDGTAIDMRPRSLSLPFGQVDLSSDPASFQYGGFLLTNFVSLAEYDIHGLRNNYRNSGIGATLSASVSPVPGQDASEWIAPQVKVAKTALVRFEHPRQLLNSGRISAKLELYDVDVTPTVLINDHAVPLQSAPSAALAYRLHDSPLWDFEIAGFRRGDLQLLGKKTEGALYFLSAYHPGRIPLVFVHGTASSPARWAEMVNELLRDPLIASRYQFWFFIYNSGNPIALSGMHLREGLKETLNKLDPEGEDPALRDMVVIGHSQGGLLTKLTSVSSGAKFWENVSKESFDSVDLSPETRDLLKTSLFVEPLPFVKRLVFISTPHHGSYVADNVLGKIGRRLITLPATISKTAVELIKLNPAGAAETALRIPTAVDNMSSSNPFLRTLSSLPISADVRAHSIIPVKGSGPVEDGKDGVVRYSSAHIEGVESELVVRSGHSCQANTVTIEEVRRILYEHLAAE